MTGVKWMVGVAVAWVFLGRCVEAQSSELAKTVTVTAGLGDAVAKVFVGSRLVGSIRLADGTGTETLYVPTGMTFSVRLFVNGEQLEARDVSWKKGERSLTVDFLQSLSATVTWTAANGSADIYVDGTSAGTTALTRQVLAGRHTFEWRQTGTVVCTSPQDLPSAATRCLKCDPATHVVTSC